MVLLSASQKLTRIGKTPTQMVTMGTPCHRPKHSRLRQALCENTAAVNN